jgi:hypothetical protein
MKNLTRAPWAAKALFALFACGWCSLAAAMDSTEILPAGINSPAFRYVILSGIDSKYTADGSILTLNEINTVNFTSDKLTQIDPQVTQFVNILNQYSQQELGTQINLGTLRIESEPTVKYIAPIYARGITDTFTLAAAVPVVFYENKLQMTQSSSNVQAICGQFSGLTKDVPEIKEACQKLDIKVVDAASDEIAKKGFKPIHDRQETLIGDAQLVGLWKFQEAESTSTLLRTTLSLPTGKKNDPDDLADLGAFGETSLEPMVVFNYLPHKHIRLAAKTGYKLTVPDSLECRVPESEGDFLPKAESKETLSRDLGDTFTLGAAVNWLIGDSFSVAGGYEYNHKGPDSYKGSRGARYDLLMKDTKSRAHKLRAGLSFDTISLYQRKKNFPPLKVDYEVTNTIAGLNTDRQIVNELSLTMFF